MRIAGAALAMIAACSAPPEKRDEPHTDPPPQLQPPRIGKVAWRVHVQSYSGSPFAFADGAAATRDSRPTIVAGKVRFATDKPDVVVEPETTDAFVNRDNEILYVVEQSDSTTEIRTLSGDRYVIPRVVNTMSAHWYDLAPGVLSATTTDSGATLSRYDHGNPKATWNITLASRDVRDARVVAWASHGPLVEVVHGDHTDLLKLDPTNGAAQPIASVSAGDVPVHLATAVATGADKLAIVPVPATPSTVQIRRLSDGKLITKIDLPSGEATALPGPPYDRGFSAMGFDGRLLWIYNYVPAHASDVLGTHSDERCGYEVYDLENGGARVRQLASATGEWKTLSQGCRVRALIPTADGGAIAVVVKDERHAEVMKFDAPP